MIRINFSTIALTSMLLASSAKTAYSKDADFSSRRDAAIKIATVAAFSQECPGIEADYQRIGYYVNRLGIDAKELQNDPEVAKQMLDAVADMRKQTLRNCIIVWEQFGYEGKGLAGILRKQ